MEGEENTRSQTTKRKVKISCGTFGGYTTHVDIQEHPFIEEICTHVKQLLRKDIQNVGLEKLVEKLDKTTFEYHAGTFDDIVDRPADTIWLCCVGGPGHSDSLILNQSGIKT